ncbi:winged helix-turn-helix transcriptional regulator [Erysipelotrichaceae bacterium RD49]|nr:winged helix-turn-helix transcriptional regulator [Erysipelotrichaceae bacterium RD49]
MDGKQVSELLDACFEVRRLTESLPPLPKGFRQRYNFVLFAIDCVTHEKEKCRVSDVSRQLNVSLPSVTKMVGELEKMDFLKKVPDQNDKRVVFLELRPKGKQYVARTKAFHSQWAANIQDGISLEDLERINQVLQILKETMPKSLPDLESDSALALDELETGEK